MSNARFSILQSRAVEDKRISNAQFRTLAALGMYGDKEGWCFPHLKTLGEILSKSKQAVSKDLQALSELGYIEITQQHRKDGSQMGNLYRLLFDPPHQPDDDPHKQDDDPRQPQMLTPISSQVDPPSTSEVDALTPHINALSNAPSEEEKAISTVAPDILEIISKATGMVAIPPREQERIEQIHLLVEAYGKEAVTRELSGAFKIWIGQKRKDGSGSYKRTNFGWVDWAQEKLSGGEIVGGEKPKVHHEIQLPDLWAGEK